MICSESFEIPVASKGLLFLLCQWLEPIDVTQLQLTHRFFLCESHVYWRTSRCVRLLSSPVLEGAIQEYFMSNHDAPELAMEQLVASLIELALDNTDGFAIAKQALPKQLLTLSHSYITVSNAFLYFSIRHHCMALSVVLRSHCLSE